MAPKNITMIFGILVSDKLNFTLKSNLFVHLFKMKKNNRNRYIQTRNTDKETFRGSFRSKEIRYIRNSRKSSRKNDLK